MDNDHPSVPEQAAVATFRAAFGYAPAAMAIAPGRVNVIGDYVDFNDGFVLPGALDLRVCLAFSPRADQRVRVHAGTYAQTAEFSLADLGKPRKHHWIDYVAGVAWTLRQEHPDWPLRGFDGALVSSVPAARGLSSSAAVEVATAHCFLFNAGRELPALELALLAQRAENEFVGVNCGVMDQCTVLLGRADHLLLLDCRSLEYRHVRMPASASLIIGDTAVSRSLADNAFNQRRLECEAGLAILNQRWPEIASWRDVSGFHIEACAADMGDTLARRARHIIRETQRVQEVADALTAGDAVRVGRLMNESQDSLRDNCDASVPPLDAMAEIMQSHPGCWGARITGAGFGGCLVALAQAGAEDGLRDRIQTEYAQRTGLEPKIYVGRISDGARVRPLEA